MPQEKRRPALFGGGLPPEAPPNAPPAGPGAPVSPAQIDNSIKIKRGTPAAGDPGSYGNGLFNTALTETFSPFSAMTPGHEGFQLPGFLNAIPATGHLLKESMMGRGASAGLDTLSGMYHGLADPVEKMVTGDSQGRAEGFGQTVSNILQMLLLNEAFKGVQAKNAPMPPPEWQGPTKPFPNPKGIGSGGGGGVPATIPPASDYIDVPYEMKGPQKSLSPAPAQQPLASAPKGPAALPPGRGGFVPPGEGGGNIPPPDEGPLPQIYRETRAPAPPTEAGTFGIERNMQGQEGGIPPRGEQTVTPTRVPHVAVNDPVTGKFRKMTTQELQDFTDSLINKKLNIGKGQTPTAGPPKPPPKSPPKPKPKGKK